MSARPVPAPAGASARLCTSTPATATIIAEAAWAQQRYDLTALSQINDGTGATIAVLDSGVDATHPQLGGAVLPGEDMLDPSGDGRQDCVGHGTAVASIIAARPVAGSGLRGLAPGARVLPILVSERAETSGSTPTGDGDVASLAAGISRAVTHRPRPSVINLSITTGVDDPALRRAIQSALDADIVVIAAAGNQQEQGDPIPYPAAYPGVIGVGAIGPDGSRLASSQTGSYVDLVAPGDHVVAAVPGGGHANYQGTSFAAPFVSATAALIRARWPRLTRTEVERRLLATADPAAGARSGYGYGVLNPMRAVTEVLTTPAPPPAPSAASPAAASLAAAAPTDLSRPSTSGTLLATVILLVLAAAVAIVGAAIPLGRRRGWRPGRVDP